MNLISMKWPFPFLLFWNTSRRLRGMEIRVRKTILRRRKMNSLLKMRHRTKMSQTLTPLKHFELSVVFLAKVDFWDGLFPLKQELFVFEAPESVSPCVWNLVRCYNIMMVTYYFSLETICCGYDNNKNFNCFEKENLETFRLWSCFVDFYIYLTDSFSDYVINY